ncbi:hypothetical protein FFM54_01620 [Burkholderia pseudomallei]|nr:hypothetical protein FFM54_01620 [Burkholderia pseudomallei]
MTSGADAGSGADAPAAKRGGARARGRARRLKRRRRRRPGRGLKRGLRRRPRCRLQRRPRRDRTKERASHRKCARKRCNRLHRRRETDAQPASLSRGRHGRASISVFSPQNIWPVIGEHWIGLLAVSKSSRAQSSAQARAACPPTGRPRPVAVDCSRA